MYGAVYDRINKLAFCVICLIHISGMQVKKTLETQGLIAMIQ